MGLGLVQMACYVTLGLEREIGYDGDLLQHPFPLPGLIHPLSVFVGRMWLHTGTSSLTACLQQCTCLFYWWTVHVHPIGQGCDLEGENLSCGGTLFSLPVEICLCWLLRQKKAKKLSRLKVRLSFCSCFRRFCATGLPCCFILIYAVWQFYHCDLLFCSAFSYVFWVSRLLNLVYKLKGRIVIRKIHPLVNRFSWTPPGLPPVHICLGLGDKRFSGGLIVTVYKSQGASHLQQAFATFVRAVNPSLPIFL